MKKLTRVEISQLYNLANQEYASNGRSKLFVRFEDMVASSGDVDLISKMSDLRGIDIFKMSKAIVESRNVTANYDFAKKYGVNVFAHGQVVIDEGSPVDNLNFAMDVKNADIQAHDLAILKSEDVEANILAARKLKINQRDHGIIVASFGNARSNAEFVESIYGADIKLHGDRIAEVGTGMDNYYFLVKNEGKVDRELHINAIKRSKDAEANYFVARNLDIVNITEFGNNVIESGHLGYNRAFAQLRGADKEAHAKCALEKGDVDEWIKFVTEVKGVDVRPFSKKIAELKNAPMSIEFVRVQLAKSTNPTFTQDDIDMHGDVVLKSKEWMDVVCYAEVLSQYLSSGVKIDRYEDYIVNTKDAGKCFTYAEKVKDVNLDKIGEVILQRGSAYHILSFVKDFMSKGVSIEPFAKRIVEIGNAEDNLVMAQLGSPFVNEHLEKVILSENPRYVESFTKIKGVNLERIEQALADWGVVSRKVQKSLKANQKLSEFLDSLEEE